MAGSVKVDTKQLRATAGKFTSTRGNIKNTTDSMLQIVHQLSGSTWSGTNASKFVSKFNGLQDEMQAIYKMVTEHIDDLNEMAAGFEAAEQAGEAEISKLKTDLF